MNMQLSAEAFRELTLGEILSVAGGFSSTPGINNPCPTNDWWPDWMEDWGQVHNLPDNEGPWRQYWTDGQVWCFYDENDNLMGRYKADSSSNTSITFTYLNGAATFEVGIGVVNGGGSTGDATGGSYTISISPY